MDEEEVDVVGLELLQRVLDRPADVFRTVQVVPDLGADEDVGALDGGVRLEEVVESITNLALIEVVPGTVQVSVSDLKGLGDSAVGLALSTLAGEGTKPHSGDGDTVAELEGLSVRHCEVNLSVAGSAMKQLKIGRSGERKKRGRKEEMKSQSSSWRAMTKGEGPGGV